MYLCFHCSSFYFKDFKFADGNGTLDGEEKAELLTFMAKAREARKNFDNRNRPCQERDQAAAATTTTAAGGAVADAPAPEGEG